MWELGSLSAALAVAIVATPVAAGSGLQTEIRAFKPIADTYVTAERPETNFGRSRVLRADAAPEVTTFLRFEVGRLTGEVTSVTLLLHTRGPARTSYEVREVRHRWRERRLTYTNAPRLSRRYTASKPVRRGTWSAVDVTPFAERYGGGEVSLAVTTRSARGLSFGSRESRYAPRLVVRTEQEA